MKYSSLSSKERMCPYDSRSLGCYSGLLYYLIIIFISFVPFNPIWLLWNHHKHLPTYLSSEFLLSHPYSQKKQICIISTLISVHFTFCLFSFSKVLCVSLLWPLSTKVLCLPSSVIHSPTVHFSLTNDSWKISNLHCPFLPSTVSITPHISLCSDASWF